MGMFVSIVKCALLSGSELLVSTELPGKSCRRFIVWYVIGGKRTHSNRTVLSRIRVSPLSVGLIDEVVAWGLSWRLAIHGYLPTLPKKVLTATRNLWSNGYSERTTHHVKNLCSAINRGSSWIVDHVHLHSLSNVKDSTRWCAHCTTIVSFARACNVTRYKEGYLRTYFSTYCKYWAGSWVELWDIIDSPPRCSAKSSRITIVTSPSTWQRKSSPLSDKKLASHYMHWFVLNLEVCTSHNIVFRHAAFAAVGVISMAFRH